MRRVSCARTSRSSTSRVCSSASWIASWVISWNTMRFTGTFGCSSSCRCQEMLSPSRSSSVARISWSDSASASFSSRDDRLLVGRHDVQRLEIVVDIDAEPGPLERLVLGGDLLRVAGQVAHVAHRRLHPVTGRQERADGARLGGRLHDHQRPSAALERADRCRPASPAGCRARFGSATTAAGAAALVAFAALVALGFVAFFAGAFFLPGGVRVAIDLRAWGREGGE